MPPTKPKTANPSTKRERNARSLYQTPNHLSYYLSKAKEVQHLLNADTRNQSSIFSGTSERTPKALRSEIGFSRKSEMLFSQRNSEWQTTARTPAEQSLQQS